MALISCVMPTYGRRGFLPHAIHYFLRQDYPDKELVVVDDGPDAVGDLVPADPRIQYVRLPQKIRQRELGVQSLARVTQVRGDDRLQPEAFVQLADQNQTGVRGDARSLKRDLQKPLKVN